MKKQRLYISVEVDEKSLLGKVARAIELEEELREILVEIKRTINMEEEQESSHSS